MKHFFQAVGVIAGVVVLSAAMATSASAQARPALTQDVDNPGRNVLRCVAIRRVEGWFPSRCLLRSAM